MYIPGMISRRLLFAVFLLVSCVSFSFSQVSGIRPSVLNPYLDSLFTEGRFSELEIEALRTLRQEPPANEDERVAAHLYLGFIEVLSNREEAASRDFHRVFSIRPGLTLDPVYVPPRIYDAFEEARQSFEEQQARELDRESKRETGIGLRYRRPGVFQTFANLIVPGTGFLIEGRYLHGITWTILEAGAAAGFVHSYLQAMDAREKYLGNRNPEQFDYLYDRYNNWYRRACYWGAGGVVVYIAAQADFHLRVGGVEVQPAVIGNALEKTPSIGIVIRR